jgi:hypothetical protein
LLTVSVGQVYPSRAIRCDTIVGATLQLSAYRWRYA